MVNNKYKYFILEHWTVKESFPNGKTWFHWNFDLRNIYIREGNFTEPHFQWNQYPSVSKIPTQCNITFVGSESLPGKSDASTTTIPYFRFLVSIVSRYDLEGGFRLPWGEYFWKKSFWERCQKSQFYCSILLMGAKIWWNRNRCFMVRFFSDRWLDKSKMCYGTDITTTAKIILTL